MRNTIFFKVKLLFDIAIASPPGHLRHILRVADCDQIVLVQLLMMSFYMDLHEMK